MGEVLKSLSANEGEERTTTDQSLKSIATKSRHVAAIPLELRIPFA